MNQKQKLGYTLLGAGIMALGIIVGEFVTPNIKAQSNGVFEKITCRELEVVNEKSAEISLGDKTVVILDNQGKNAIDLINSNIENGVSVYDRKSGKTGISLYADERESGIIVIDKASNIKWKVP